MPICLILTVGCSPTGSSRHIDRLPEHVNKVTSLESSVTAGDAYVQAIEHLNAGNLDLAIAVLGQRTVTDVPEALRSDWVLAHSRVLLLGKMPQEAFFAWESLFSASLDSQFAFSRHYNEVVSPPLRIELLKQAGSSAPWIAIVAAGEADRLWNERDLAGARSAVELGLAVPECDAVISSTLTTLRDRLERLAAVQPTALGILVPLSGPYHAFGQSVLRAVQMAKHDLGATVSLHVEDSGADPVLAHAAAERLIVEERVAAILGPVGPKECGAVMPVAEDNFVPTMMLAVELPNGPRSFVVQGRLTPQQESFALVQHAMGDLSCQTFAILAPNNRSGQVMADAFRGSVEYASSKVVYHAVIDMKAQKTVEFRGISQKIVSQYRRNPFSALYLPMNGSDARSLLAYLKAAGLHIRTDPREIAAVQVLGSSDWLAADIVDLAEGTTDNAVFPAVFFDDSTSAATQTFITSFQSRYSVIPSAFEAEVYDAAIALLSVLEGVQPGGFVGEEILAQLFTLGTIEGVAGRYSFVSNGTVRREVQILTVDADYVRKRENIAEEVRVRSR